MADNDLLLGRVAAGLEALVREQATFRQETNTTLAAISGKLEAHGTELNVARGVRRENHRHMTVIATIVSAVIAAAGHLAVRLLFAGPTH